MSIVLVTGGLGFIGSHTTLKFLQNGYDVLIIDSLINSSKNIISCIEKILNATNIKKKGKIIFRKGDVRDFKFLNDIFKEFIGYQNPIESVIHFAGLKSVTNSINEPINYWDINVNGTINLLSVMSKYGCYNFVFSSSATIYNADCLSLINEDKDLKPINPYGNTKFVIERFLKDLYESEKNLWRIASLRYFNPAGAHYSGFLGENPKTKSTNLFPQIIKALEKQIQYLPIYGNDWPTKDGTCVRDFIHITDLAEAHLLSLVYLVKNEPQNISLNIGTGKGATIMDVINTFKLSINQDFKYKFVQRRAGDFPDVVADNKLAKDLLLWVPKKNLLDMCKDAWNFNQNKKKSH